MPHPEITTSLSSVAESLEAIHALKDVAQFFFVASIQPGTKNETVSIIAADIATTINLLRVLVQVAAQHYGVPPNGLVAALVLDETAEEIVSIASGVGTPVGGDN